MDHLIRRTRSIACASLLALVALGVGAAGASAAGEAPEISKPPDQFSTVNEPIVPVLITGKHLESGSLTDEGTLPAGLVLHVISEEEAKIEGEPTVAHAGTTVTLKAVNEGEPDSVTFHWTVETAPVFTAAPAEVRSTVEREIAPVIVNGTNLHALTEEGLPAGLKVKELSETEWQIEGKPTSVQATAPVTLKATNRAGTAAAAPATIQWTVEAPPAIESAPGEQASTAGQQIVPVRVKGANLFAMSAEGLPAGLELERVSESEWTIVGKPETPVSVTVTLKASNRAGGASGSATFHWTVEAPPAIAGAPGDQTSTTGQPISPVIVNGTGLFALAAKELPAGLALTKVSETQWTITGTPTAATASTTVVLEAKNKAGGAGKAVSFGWTVGEPAPTKAVETPAKPPETPIPPTVPTPSAGRLGTLPTQKPGKALSASFLCEVTSCKVSVKATITAGKKKFNVHSARTAIAQGKKAKIALKLSKSQQALVAAALKKHKKVAVALMATIDSSVGYQVTKTLIVTVKR